MEFDGLHWDGSCAGQVVQIRAARRARTLWSVHRRAAGPVETPDNNPWNVR